MLRSDGGAIRQTHIEGRAMPSGYGNVSTGLLSSISYSVVILVAITAEDFLFGVAVTMACIAMDSMRARRGS